MTPALLAQAVDDGSRNPGPLPLLIVLLIGVATVLLIRNMNARIKRLPKDFPEDPPTDDERPGTG